MTEDELRKRISVIVRSFEQQFCDEWGQPCVFLGMRERLVEVAQEYAADLLARGVVPVGSRRPTC